MFQLFTLRVLSSLLLIKLAISSTIYVSPSQTCSKTCTGDFSDPFNNILSALQQACQSENTTISLLYDPLLFHYIIPNNANTGVTASNSANPPSEYICENLIIKPLFCNEEIVGLYPGELSTKCIDPDKKLTVYMKTTDFTISISNSIIVKNIIFDAIEDIKNINVASSELDECLYNRKRCCYAGDTFSSLYPNNIISCAFYGDYSSLSLSPTTSLFRFENPTGALSLKKSMVFEDTGFQNFLSPHLQSLIETESGETSSLFIRRTTINRVYFDKGILFHRLKDGSSNNLANSSYITFEQISFSNYNTWSLQLQNQLRGEGYLFSSASIFSGVLSIINSTFANTTSSLRDKCWPQTDTYYTLPMNNLLTTDPRSRSHLWSQYDANRGDKDFVSSLIYINQIYGAVTLSQATTFTNIVGTSGSVLRVDDVISSDTWFTISMTPLLMPPSHMTASLTS